MNSESHPNLVAVDGVYLDIADVPTPVLVETSDRLWLDQSQLCWDDGERDDCAIRIRAIQRELARRPASPDASEVVRWAVLTAAIADSSGANGEEPRDIERG